MIKIGRDNAKCAGAIQSKCPLRAKCKRYMSIISDRQVFAVYKYKNGKCEYFWEIESEE